MMNNSQMNPKVKRFYHFHRVTVSEIGSFTVYNYKKRNGVKAR